MGCSSKRGIEIIAGDANGNIIVPETFDLRIFKILVEKEKMAYHIKRFKNWKKEVRPYVQENGHILTQEERTAIWMRQQEEMKKSSDKK